MNINSSFKFIIFFLSIEEKKILHVYLKTKKKNFFSPKTHGEKYKVSTERTLKNKSLTEKIFLLLFSNYQY